MKATICRIFQSFVACLVIKSEHVLKTGLIEFDYPKNI